ncbi:hypothetical protein EIP91_010970 [Steccherinum ochraceum]|uniref:DUF7918 domain-containing protein n=1 Tax=Steccherinum ochraceum TaxID=92696 RepID=A0A4R0RMD7_9APHY|nr:hypothetical protein EIP91_010970 [Steccherinum ochraceum]
MRNDSKCRVLLFSSSSQFARLPHPVLEIVCLLRTLPVMPTVRDISVSIQVNGASLEEYSVERPNAETATCYVASQAGETFGIDISNQSDYLSFSVRIYMDGSMVVDRLYDPGDIWVVDGVSGVSNTFRSFKFADLHLTDDDRLLPSDRSKWNNLGCIELRVFRLVPGTRVPIHNPVIVSPSLNTEPIHERSKKAGAHRVVLGDPQARQSNVTHYNVVRLDPPERPYAKIKFVYRPHDILRAQSIILSPPRNSDALRALPSISGFNAGRAVDADNSRNTLLEAFREREAAQAQTRERYLAALEEERRRVRAEIAAADRRAGIKREPSIICVPPPPPGERVVIDLTDD